MDSEEFLVRGKEMVEYIRAYVDNIERRRVVPSIEPGYLRKLLSAEAPQNPEPWEDIMRDVEEKIMPGVTHWQHPRFHAYFPSGNSYPSILGDMLSSGIGAIGFSWAACPALTELETIVVDWFGKHRMMVIHNFIELELQEFFVAGKAIGLPDEFLSFKEGSRGGGVIQTSASECVLVSMLAARAQAIKRLKQQHPFIEEGLLLSKLMAYCSREAHSCVEKAAMISFVKLRILEPDEKSSLRGKTLMMAMEEDETMGLIPFFVSTTLGTTGSCAFDNLPEIATTCKRFPSVWLHVDGAYAGCAMICPELKPLLSGIEHADSFNTNPNKWLLTNFDCSTMWVRDRLRLTSALVVDPLYLQHGYSDATIDYRHWGVPLSRRFRSLKLWFVLRSYGIKGLQNYIRLHIALAKRFEKLVLNDERFEVCNEVKLGLVCFRLVGSDKLNEKLLTHINASGKLHMVPAQVNERYVIRFCAVAQNAKEEDIDYAWKVITEFAEELLERESEKENKQESRDKVFDLLDKRHKENLAHKRSFFVRMVSDPKIYNPAITKSSTATTRHLSETIESPEGNITIQPPSRSSSWISWPLAFLFHNSNNEDGSASTNVPIRFRHLDTKVRLKAGKSQAPAVEGGRSGSPSPEGDNGRSPKRSPVLFRKPPVSPEHRNSS